MSELIAPRPEHQRLVRKLESIASLGAEERRAIADLPLIVRQVVRDEVVVREGDRPTQCCLLVEGMLYRYKVLPNGARQILSFHVQGDLPDLQSLHLGVMDHSLGAVSNSKVAFISHTAVQHLIERYPVLGAALWREALVDGSIFREWITGIGRRSSYQRIAHLMCELSMKLQAAGAAGPEGYPFPITQTELGDALGLSVVHVNRVLQDLRRDGLIVLRERYLAIPSLTALMEAGLFDPAYLHLDHEGAN
ncbi:MAG: Crp/Fnr family transcriptional regulator [Caulobacteraceae bacterium]